MNHRHSLRAFRFEAAILSLLLVSCAGGADRRRGGEQATAPIAAVSHDGVQAAIAEAMALSLAGKTQQALESVAAALGAAKDTAALAGALEAKAWALLFSGSRDAAKEAVRESAAIGMPMGPGRAVLEFRLAADDGIAAARLRAAEALATPGLGERARLAMAVMLGEKDLRDVKIDSPEAAREFATYLAGYRLSPAAVAPGAVPSATVPVATAATVTAQANAAITAARAADGPVVVVSAPESVGADEATIAVTRLACRDALAKRGAFRVVDAESRKAAMEELELSLSEASAGDKDMAIGGLFSADYVASGSVVKADAGWLVAYTLSSSSDGRILASDFALAADHAAILAVAGRFAEALDAIAALR